MNCASALYQLTITLSVYQYISNPCCALTRNRCAFSFVRAAASLNVIVVYNLSFVRARVCVYVHV